MITLDEAIEQERKQVEKYRCDYYCKCFVDGHVDVFECIKNKREHEQLLEWLEELKKLRETSCGYSKEDIELNRNAAYEKAIDDFMEKVVLKYLGVNPDELYEKYYPSEICKQIKELAEQLKESDLK